MTKLTLKAITITDQDGIERTLDVKDLRFAVADHGSGHGTLTAEFAVPQDEYKRPETGYYAVPGRGTVRSSVHAVADRKRGPMCGAKPAGEFQWTNSAIECARCWAIFFSMQEKQAAESAAVVIHEW